jgi:protein disulfide-isomerase A6
LKGVVRVGAIDVDTHKATGSKYGVQGFPTIKFFGMNKKNSPVDYKGGRDADAIVNYALDTTA